MRQLQIQEFDGSDAAYETWCAICNVINPDHIQTAQELKRWETQREERIAYGKWFGMVDGEAVGVVEYSQMVWAYHPQKFIAYVGVLPEKQGAGIGRQLFEHLMAVVAPLNPISLRCDIRSDWARSARFVADRGFEEDFRTWESRLDVKAFDPAPFAALRDKPLEHGILIKTAGQLKAEDPGFARKLWEMDQEASQDIPTPETFTPLSFETYHKMVLEDPNFLNDGFFIAVDGETGEYAGLSALWRRKADDHLSTGFTGVRRKYRRKGIAMALKLRAVEYARSVGCPVIRTDNATSNRPMLSINEALGFEKQPVWISLWQKPFRPTHRKFCPMSLPVVPLSGSPYAMGVTHGTVLKDRVVHNVALYYDRFQREIHLDRAAVHAVAVRFAAQVEKASPDYYAGMQGVAAGSGLDFLDIAALNARYEILYYQFGRLAMEQGAGTKHGAADREATPDGCTAFAALPDITANGHLLVGQNWDWIPETQGAVLHTMEADGLQTLAFTESGIVGAKIGFNSAGVSLCINGMTTVDDDWTRAVTPFHVRCYNILRSRTLEEAVQVLAGEERACAGNFLIAQTPDRVADVEAAPDKINILSCNEGCLTHANHFVNPSGLGIVEAPNDRRVYSRNRQNRLRELLMQRLPLTIEGIQDALRDTRDEPFGICRHRDYQVGPEEHYTTVTAVVIDLTDRVLHLTDGPPDESPFQTVSLKTIPR